MDGVSPAGTGANLHPSGHGWSKHVPVERAPHIPPAASLHESQTEPPNSL